MRLFAGDEQHLADDAAPFEERVRLGTLREGEGPSDGYAKLALINEPKQLGAPPNALAARREDVP